LLTKKNLKWILQGFKKFFLILKQYLLKKWDYSNKQESKL